MDMKGTIFALETFHKFYQEHGDAHFTIIGKGPLKQRLEEYVAENHLQDCVDIISWLPQEDLFGYYQHAHVFFFPSMESQGLVVTEAMQFGLPIVCLQNYGPHSLAREAALTVEHKRGALKTTQEGLLAKLTHLYTIKDTEEYQALRDTTRTAYEKHLTVEAQVQQILKHY